MYLFGYKKTEKNVPTEIHFSYIIYMDDTFWTRVKRELKAHKISQLKFAEYVGINPYTFRGWIQYNRMPDAVSTCDIADALGVTMEYLVKGKAGAAEEDRMKQVEERKSSAARIKSLVSELGVETERLR